MNLPEKFGNMNNKLPFGYKEGVTRVTKLVEYVYPFDENSEARFVSWLEGKGIKQEDYMNIASTRGTEIHKTLEHWVGGIAYVSHLYEQIINEINHGKKWIEELNIKYPDIIYKTEEILIDKNLRFQGTIDLVRLNEETKEARLYDYKSWEITKKAFGLEQRLNKNGTPPKPTEKLKKLALQLSLYALILEQQGRKIMGLYGVWLHDSGCYEYEVERWNTEELEKMIVSYFTRNIEIPPQFIIKIKDMKITIHTPLIMPREETFKQFTFSEIELGENDFEGTYEEKINEAVRLQKYSIKQYMEGKL